MTEEGKLNVLFVDDETIAHDSVGRYLQKCGHRVTFVLDGHAALAAAAAHAFDVALLDMRMPRMDGLTLLDRLHEDQPDLPCVICTGHADIEMAVGALRGGAMDFLRKPVVLVELDAVLERVTRMSALSKENRLLKGAMRGLRTAARLRSGGLHFLGKSPAAQKVQEQIALAAESGCETVLITGNTGVGKEIVAREIHDRSVRAEGPFVPVNCPAIPESILNNELFGHREGAFTGAAESQTGYFEMANGGTLFLDEIADLTPSAQAAILRVVETRRVRRVGGGDEVPLDLTLVVASNRDLAQMAAEGQFRQDLYYRLNLFSISVPSLAERHTDIKMLATHFIEQYQRGRKAAVPGISEEALAMLQRYDYPGNARELRNLVERACIVCRDETITPEHLAFAPPLVKKGGTGGAHLANDERTRIEQALCEARWNRRKASELLGISYSSLREKIAKYALR